MGRFPSFYAKYVLALPAILITILCVTLFARTGEQRSPFPAPSCESTLLCPGEDLLYEVKYLGIKLGTIRVQMQSIDSTKGERRYMAISTVDTYNGIPFVDLHVVNTTRMDTDFYSRGFHAYEKHGNRWLDEMFHYDLEHYRIIVEKAYTPELYAPRNTEPIFDTVHLQEKNIADGLALLFFARRHVRQQGEISIPTVVYGKRGMTHLRCIAERSEEEIDAVQNRKIRVIGLEGTAQFKGLYGMTGDFKGWFSDDQAAIPIKAEIGVFIGNVDIELIKWDRAGWQPPTVPE